MTLQRHLGAILWPVLGTGLLALSGCGRDASRPDERRSTPFVFQALNLRQQDAGGRLLWRVTSPEARYDLSRRLAQARQLRGEIHANGRALYQLQASHGTVINDGAVIQLEGEVRMDKQYSLEQHELDRGFVLSGQAHPVTPEVRLSFDER